MKEQWAISEYPRNIYLLREIQLDLWRHAPLFKPVLATRAFGSCWATSSLYTLVKHIEHRSKSNFIKVNNLNSVLWITTIWIRIRHPDLQLLRVRRHPGPGVSGDPDVWPRTSKKPRIPDREMAKEGEADLWGPAKAIVVIDVTNIINQLIKLSNWLLGKSKTQTVFDEKGILRHNGKDLCDCMIPNCPGCHFPCPKCQSEKCGAECRQNRKWQYESSELDGVPNSVFKNKYLDPASKWFHLLTNLYSVSWSQNIYTT